MSEQNPGRERILARIRQGLRTPAPHHAGAQPAAAQARAYFPAIDDPWQRFLAECQVNQTEILQTRNAEETAVRLAEVLAQLPEGGVFVQDEAGLRQLTQLLEARGGVREWHWSSQGGPRPDDAAGLSRCESLVAMTGSLLFSSRCGGRAVSVLPPCHIVIAQRSQLAVDVEEALQRLQAEGVVPQLSYVGLVTGPSRTADIERIVVMGAHGPMRLIVIIEDGVPLSH